MNNMTDILKTQDTEALKIATKNNIKLRGLKFANYLDLIHHENVNFEFAQLLLDSGVDIELAGDLGAPPLHSLAMYGNNNQLIKLLIEYGVNIDSLDALGGSTALMQASYFGNKETAQLLMSNGADINYQNEDGWTALLVASLQGKKEIVSLLVKNDVDINLQNKDGSTALIDASEKGHTEIVKLLLENGSNIDHQDEDGRTALSYASIHGHAKIVKLLLENNADVNYQNEDGCTALFIASLQGKKEIVNLLLENNADANIYDKHGFTALTYAVSGGYLEIVKLLLENGVDVNFQDKGGWTALLYALDKEYNEIVKILLVNGADVNFQYKDGSNVLIGASSNGYTKIVKLLIENGADVNFQTESGLTALIHASSKGHAEIAKLLLENGADVNHQSKDGTTALYSVSLQGYINIAKLLLENNADTEVKDSVTGNTALIEASADGKKEIVQLLIDNGANIETRKNKPFITQLYRRSYYAKNKVGKYFLNGLIGIFKFINNNGDTALMQASKNRHDDIVELLVANGANTDYKYKQETHLNPKIEKIIMSIVVGINKIIFLGTPGENAVTVKDLELAYPNRVKNPMDSIIHARYEIDRKNKLNNPQKLVDLLKNFRIDTPIKYTTHAWDMDFEKDYGDFKGFMLKVKKQWETIEKKLEDLSPELHRKIYDFLINEKEATQSWCSKDGDDLCMGWASLKGLEAWCDAGKKPFEFKLSKEYTVEGKTITHFKQIIELFKQEIQIRREANVLESIFTDKEEWLDDKYEDVFEMKTIKLTGKQFYTDTETFRKIVDKIFDEIVKHPEHPSIQIEIEESDDDSYYELCITQKGSSAGKSSQAMLNMQDGGDFGAIRDFAENLCDWSIESSHDEEYYRVNYLKDVSKNKIEKLNNKPEGFMHRLRFYI